MPHNNQPFVVPVRFATAATPGALRTVARVMVASMLLLGGLFIADGGPAEAQPAATCPQGVQSGVVCAIEGDPQVVQPYCPVSATVIFDGTACFTYVVKNELPPICTTPYQLSINNRCIVTNVDVVASFSCPPVDRASTLNTETVELQGESVISVCVERVPVTFGACPTGSTSAQRQYYCRRPVPLIRVNSCAPGFDSIGNQRCFKYELAPGVALSCAAGKLGDVGGRRVKIDACVVEGAPPVDASHTCPTDSGLNRYTEGECYRLVDPVAGACPPPSVPDADSARCREPVDLLGNDRACEPGLRELGSRRCVRLVEPLGLPSFDCLSADLGSPACFNLPQIVQDPPDIQILSQRSTVLAFSHCDGGRVAYGVKAGQVFIASGYMIEDPGGTYRTTFEFPNAGHYTIEVRPSCAEPVPFWFGRVLAVQVVGPVAVGPVSDSAPLPAPGPFTVMPDTSPGPYGFGDSPRRSDDDPATDAQNAVDAAQSEPTPGLALTGVASAPLAAAGFALVGLGSSLLAVRRRAPGGGRVASDRSGTPR